MAVLLEPLVMNGSGEGTPVPFDLEGIVTAEAARLFQERSARAQTVLAERIEARTSGSETQET